MTHQKPKLVNENWCFDLMAILPCIWWDVRLDLNANIPIHFYANLYKWRHKCTIYTTTYDAVLVQVYVSTGANVEIFALTVGISWTFCFLDGILYFETCWILLENNVCILLLLWCCFKDIHSLMQCRKGFACEISVE